MQGDELALALHKAANGALLSPEEMAIIFRIGRAQFHKLNKTGAFDQFRVHPKIGPKCFSGVLVHQYLSSGSHKREE